MAAGLKLTRSEIERLINALRKQFLYQTPTPVFADEKVSDPKPSWIVLKMKPEAYATVMQLIHKAGGWTLPPEAKAELLKQHEAAARRAYGDGTSYDFSHLEIGDLNEMFTETKRLAELREFHEALGDEIRARHSAEAPEQH